MASSPERFPDPSEILTVPPRLGEPVLWVRRVVIWETPEEIIREVRLHRGVNVVWSPDVEPAPTSDLGGEFTPGHGAGKTLLCRLIRFCLGEVRFASKRLRKEIRRALPKGRVGADLRIGGASWAVVRGLGRGTGTIVARDGSLEDLVLRPEDEMTGIAPLLDALNTIFPTVLDKLMPATDQVPVHHYALAWLTRDQECRFRHPLEWRHPESDSESPLTKHSKQDVATIVRALLGILSSEELVIRRDHETAATARKSANDAVLQVRSTATRRVSQLAQQLGADAALSGAPELSERALQEALDAAYAKAEPSDAKLDDLDDAVATATEELGGLRQQLATGEKVRDAAIALRAEQDRLLRDLGNELDQITADAIKRSLGTDECPVCHVQIDDALATGCPLAAPGPTPDEDQARRARLDAAKRSCAERLRRANDEVSKRALEFGSLWRLTEAKKRAVEVARENRRKARAAHRRRMRELDRQSDQFEQLRDDLRALNAQESRSREAISEDKTLAEELAALRARHDAGVAVFGERFAYAARAMAGRELDCRVKFVSDGVRLALGTGGVAMESVKVLAFDIAALLLAMEGRAHLPAFLVHDSPREADLAPTLYRRFFHLAAALEKLGDPPPFQYIITTTTEPPRNLGLPPERIHRLGGTTNAELLLGRTLAQGAPSTEDERAVRDLFEGLDDAT